MMVLVGAVVVALLGGCSGDDVGGSVSSSTPPSTGTTTTTTVPVTETTAPPVTSTVPGEPTELTLDVVASTPSVPWGSGVTGHPGIHLSGAVTTGAEVFFLVTSAAGEVVFEGQATVEGDRFEGDVTLAEGGNTVITIAGFPDGETIGVEDVAREMEVAVEFTFLTHVSATEIVADYAQWLTGDEANQAAFEDGVIGSVEEGVPNDYYIRNVNPRLRTLPLADDVRVWLVSAAEGSVGSVAVEVAEWLALFNDEVPWDYGTEEPPDWEGPHYGYFGSGTVYAGYWLVIVEGEVIAIERQYVP